MLHFTTVGLLQLVVALAPIPNPGSRPVAILEDSRRDLGGELGPGFLSRQVAALKHVKVLREALRRPGVRELRTVSGEADPVSWVSKHLQVELDEKTSRLHVSFAKGSAREQAEIINAVVEVYLKELRQELCQPLEAYLAKQENELRQQREKLSRQRLQYATRQPLGDLNADKEFRDIELQVLVQSERNLEATEIIVQRQVRKLRSALRIVLVQKAQATP